MTNVWIFQANPGRYDIDAFLADPPLTFTWTALQSPSEMRVGDMVYLWRALGPDRDPRAGVVAEAVIVEEPHVRPDLGHIGLWQDPADAARPISRALLSMVRVARTKEIIKRDWLKYDPILRDLRILRMANATNFLVSDPHQKARLEALWTRTGRDWTYAESVAGLWAYAETYGGSVSQLPGTPVAEVARLIGRTIGGVYNKVMNFRAVDPRDPRKGLPAGSEMDELVWARFFDPAAGLRGAELRQEFEALWPDREAGESVPLVEAPNPETEAKVLASQFTLEELLARFAARLPASGGKAGAKRRSTWVRSYSRDPLMIAIAKVRAGGRCEVPECTHPTFLDGENDVFVEVHHIEPLSEGGEDVPGNVACVCPAHHREAHFGVRARELRSTLALLRQAGSTPPP